MCSFADYSDKDTENFMNDRNSYNTKNITNMAE